jgi:hypothetical protein
MFAPEVPGLVSFLSSSKFFIGFFIFEGKGVEEVFIISTSG